MDGVKPYSLTPHFIIIQNAVFALVFEKMGSTWIRQLQEAQAQVRIYLAGVWVHDPIHVHFSNVDLK